MSSKQTLVELNKPKLDEMCFQTCFKTVFAEVKVTQQNCMENCMRKLVNGMIFMNEVESKGGLKRNKL